jgi:hypothetical protein
MKRIVIAGATGNIMRVHESDMRSLVEVTNACRGADCVWWNWFIECALICELCNKYIELCINCTSPMGYLYIPELIFEIQ